MSIKVACNNPLVLASLVLDHPTFFFIFKLHGWVLQCLAHMFMMWMSRCQRKQLRPLVKLQCTFLIHQSTALMHFCPFSPGKSSTFHHRHWLSSEVNAVFYLFISRTGKRVFPTGRGLHMAIIASLCLLSAL